MVLPMTGFFIKKAFYDGWDNLFQIIVLNITMLAIAFGGWFLAGATVSIVPLSLLVALCTVLLEGVLLMAVTTMMARVVSFKSFSIKDFLGAVKDTWKHGLLYAAFLAACGGIFAVSLPYYLGLGTLPGFVFAVIMFWVAVICILSLQWFLPIRSQLDVKFFKCLKKSFIIFFDNPGFSLFMLFYTLVLLAVSFFCVMLLPGVPSADVQI